MDLASKDEHIKRPLNSFMVWAKERRRLMNRNNPRMRNAEISKILGEEWRKMPEEEKKPYVDEAVRLRRQHKVDHPNYRYRPRRKNRLDSSSENGTPDRLTAFSFYPSCLSSPTLITPAVSERSNVPLCPRFSPKSSPFSLDFYQTLSGVTSFPVRAVSAPSWHGFLSPVRPPPPCYIDTPCLPRLPSEGSVSGAPFCFTKQPTKQFPKPVEVPGKHPWAVPFLQPGPEMPLN